LGQTIRKVYAGLDDRSAIRRTSPASDVFESDEEAGFNVKSALDQRSPQQITRRERALRLTELRGRALSEDDAFAAALGLEFWGLGIQLLFAIDGEKAAATINNR
jgi:hypothetical protein